MAHINIKHLGNNGWVNYSDESLAFINDTETLSHIFSQAELQTGFVLCIVCIQGKLQVSVDNARQCISAHQALVCPIHSVINDYLHSPDFRAIAICANPHVFKEFYLNKQMWEYYQFALRNHIVNFTDKDWQRMFRYHDLLTEHLSEQTLKYHQQIVRSIWQSVIYEFISILDRNVNHVAPSKEQIPGMELLSSRFMETLTMSEGRIHTVAEIADRLHVTPKYLSTAVKKTTGKTALKWIHEATLKEAERMLQSSDQSIKEIAFQLNFPNASFFSKFIRIHLGYTPTRIRKQE